MAAQKSEASDRSAESVSGESDVDKTRQGHEQKILLAVIVVPILLGLIRAGMHQHVIDWLSTAILFIKRTETASQWLITFLMTATVLLAWRHPILGKPYTSPVATIFGFAAMTFYRNAYSGFYYASAYWLVVYCPILILFVLLRVIGRFCITAEKTECLPEYGRLSILNLIYWTAGFAILFTVIPPLVRSVIETYQPMGMTLSLIPWMFAPTMIVTSAMLLSVMLTWQRAWWIRLVAAFATMVVLSIASAWYFAWYYNTPPMYSWGRVVFDSLVQSTATVVGFWWSTRGARDIKRFPKCLSTESVQRRIVSR